MLNSCQLRENTVLKPWLHRGTRAARLGAPNTGPFPAWRSLCLPLAIGSPPVHAGRGLALARRAPPGLKLREKGLPLALLHVALNDLSSGD